jgi:hypothetical protein
VTDREPCTCGAEINYIEGICRNGHPNTWVFRQSGHATAETIARDTTIHGTTYSYDGVPLDPAKVIMHVRRANGEISSATTEYGVIMSGGGVQVRPNDPVLDRHVPLDQWIDAERNVNRTRVVRRRVIVIDDWEEVTEP